MRLNDRVAIVTGAARGIGQEYCLGLEIMTNVADAQSKQVMALRSYSTT